MTSVIRVTTMITPAGIHVQVWSKAMVSTAAATAITTMNSTFCRICEVT